MKKTKKLLSLMLLLVIGTYNIAFGATKAEPLFNKADYLPNDTEAQIEANSMKWFEERVKYVKENIKMLPDDFMEYWSWDKPLTRMEFLVLMTPMRTDSEMFNDMPIGRQPIYVDLIPNEKNGYVHYWMKEQNTDKPIRGSDLKFGWQSEGDMKFFTGNEDINKYQYRYWYVHPSRQDIFKGTDEWDETLMFHHATKMADYLKKDLPTPFTLEIYELLKKQVDGDFWTWDRPMKYFRPDKPLNLAEAVTATTRAENNYYNTEKKSTIWYQSSLEYIENINGISPKSNLIASDIPNTKQMARMMFMTLFDTVDFDISEEEMLKNHPYDKDPNLYSLPIRTWNRAFWGCSQERYKELSPGKHKFYCTEQVN